jgi:hypothetical protein
VRDEQRAEQRLGVFRDACEHAGKERIGHAQGGAAITQGAQLRVGDRFDIQRRYVHDRK